MSVALDTPFKTEQSIRSVNFFNNRLLSAEDLNAEKAANRAEHKQLGRALGDGIVRGLEVSVQDKALPSLTVTAGLAINRSGRAVELSDDVVVVLPTRPPTDNVTAATIAEFEECLPPQAGVYLLNEGVYLFTIQPGEVPEGRAQVSGLNGAAAGCNIKYRVSAVKFRLISLDDQLNQELSDLQVALNAANSATLARVRNQQNHLLRNRVAHRCFGTGDARLDSFSIDPFGATATDYGLLADLRQLGDKHPGKLTHCEVPLALVYWTGAGLQWLDMWSVRRRITPADPSGPAWPLLADRRVSETEAMFWQFQAQTFQMQNDPLENLGAISATDRLRYLPPVGLLAIQGANSPTGFNVATFWGTRASEDIALIDGDLLRELWQLACYHAPIDLRTPDKIQLYRIYENVKAVESQQSKQLSLVFAKRTLPYRGIARFGYAHWKLSRLAPQVI